MEELIKKKGIYSYLEEEENLFLERYKKLSSKEREEIKEFVKNEYLEDTEEAKDLEDIFLFDEYLELLEENIKGDLYPKANEYLPYLDLVAMIADEIFNGFLTWYVVRYNNISYLVLVRE